MACAQLFAALLVLCVARGLSGSIMPTTTPAGCVKDGKYFLLGDTYYPTPCQQCRCETTGQMLCVWFDCFFVPCVDSVRDPTKCCRECPNGHNCKHSDGTIIKQGEKYHPDAYTTCECPQNVFGLHGVDALCSVV